MMQRILQLAAESSLCPVARALRPFDYTSRLTEPLRLTSSLSAYSTTNHILFYDYARLTMLGNERLFKSSQTATV